MNNLGLVGVIMIFYKNSLFLILLLSALYLFFIPSYKLISNYNINIVLPSNNKPKLFIA